MKKQKPKPSLKRDAVFALRGWSIKTQGGKFFAAPTAYFEDKTKWVGPYTTLQNTTQAISRRLAEEFTTRKSKVEKPYARRR